MTTEPPSDLLEESPVSGCSAHSGILLILCPQHHQEKAEEEEMFFLIARAG